MEVDRVAPMGGVGQDADPSWTRQKMRRRKFTEEVPESEAELSAAEAEEAVEEDERVGSLDVVA
ncbi:MAG TPA: hypothetical protein VHX37_18300 [Acidobacteriaceae bacterium]|jgi:hypothetical protein|nr:hypothetical protein [Acidobacteriaceae bacterium]